MARQTFTWYPTASWGEDQQPVVDIIKFGDGYEQRIAKGINSSPVNVAVEFEGLMSEINDIKAFLIARGGVESFNWTTPLSLTGYFVARKWRVERLNEAILKLTTTFEQVYE